MSIQRLSWNFQFDTKCHIRRILVFMPETYTIHDNVTYKYLHSGKGLERKISNLIKFFSKTNYILSVITWRIYIIHVYSLLRIFEKFNLL